MVRFSVLLIKQSGRQKAQTAFLWVHSIPTAKENVIQEHKGTTWGFQQDLATRFSYYPHVNLFKEARFKATCEGGREYKRQAPLGCPMNQTYDGAVSKSLTGVALQ